MIGLEIKTGAEKCILLSGTPMLGGVIDGLGGSQLKFVDEDVVGHPVITEESDELRKRLGNILQNGIFHIEAAAEFTLHCSMGW